MAEWKGMEITGALAHVIDEFSELDKAYYDYIDDLSDKIYAAMEGKGMSKADLARATGKSRSWVTKVLSGDNNMTMKTFVAIVHAMHMKAETEIVENQAVASWKHIHEELTTNNITKLATYKKASKLKTFERYNNSTRQVLTFPCADSDYAEAEGM